MPGPCRILLAALAAPAAWCPATAQGVASSSVNAAAHVAGVRTGLTAGGINNLQFGIVFAGGVYTPTALASDAARFGVHGQPTTPVTVSFILPGTLANAALGTIPIAFDNTSGLLWTSYPATHVTFDPRAAQLLVLDAAGDLMLGIVGTISPPIGTVTGFYVGVIALIVSY